MESTRRGFLVSAGLAGLGLGVGADRVLESGEGAHGGGSGSALPFFGMHQAGIATPTQEHLQFGAFDVVSESVNDLRGLLHDWSAAAASLVSGSPVGFVATGDGAPQDTGESLGLPPARLTVTFGLGRGLFVRAGRDRFGLAARLPPPLVVVPSFAGEALDESISGGDLCVQACADDPQVAFHAMHNLARIVAGVAVPRWVLGGFGRTSNSRSQETPRNLMGFKDGTDNVVAEDPGALERFVWAREPESPPWMRGGSYVVVRRIRMLLGAWDATSLNDQERTFGRRKVSGAPLTGTSEHDRVDLSARSAGLPVISPDAHIRLASPAYNGGERILRRGYSYVDGIDAVTSSVSGGLLFVCYQRDPRAQFIRIQRRLAGTDALNRHVEHIGSALFACPPGARRGGFVGEGLFE